MAFLLLHNYTDFILFIIRIANTNKRPLFSDLLQMFFQINLITKKR